MSAFSAIFVFKENGTQSHSAKFRNWGDHVKSVPDLAASQQRSGLNAGQQCMAMSLCALIYNYANTINTSSDLVTDR